MSGWLAPDEHVCVSVRWFGQSRKMTSFLCVSAHVHFFRQREMLTYDKILLITLFLYIWWWRLLAEVWRDESDSLFRTLSYSLTPKIMDLNGICVEKLPRPIRSFVFWFLFVFLFFYKKIIWFFGILLCANKFFVSIVLFFFSTKEFFVQFLRFFVGNKLPFFK